MSFEMSLKNMPSTYTKTFIIQVKLLKVVGLDIFEESTSFFNWSNLRLAIYCCILLPFIYTQITIVPRIMAISFMEGVRVIAIDAIFLFCLVKMTTIVCKRSQIRDMFLEIGELWPEDDDSGEESKTALKKYLSRERSPLNMFMMYSYINAALYEAVPLLTSIYYMCAGINDYLFPFEPSSPWAYDNNFTFTVIYLWQLLCSAPGVICVYVAFDIMVATMTLNVSVLLKWLQIDVKNCIIINDEDKELKEMMHVSDRKSGERIKQVVRRHQQLLKLSDKLNDIFGPIILIHLIFGSVEICFFGFLTVVYDGFLDSAINLITGMNAMLSIFLLSLSGQTLYDTSTKLADAAYDSLWYASDENVRKGILFIILRAQSPCYLSALGFSQLTLSAFSKIMSSAFSYFSILIQMFREK